MAKAEAMSLIQFQKQFGTEEDCASYMMHKRWKDGFSCPKCEHGGFYYIKTRMLYECSNAITSHRSQPEHSCISRRLVSQIFYFTEHQLIRSYTIGNEVMFLSSDIDYERQKNIAHMATYIRCFNFY